jgi:hypothetical protein
MPVLRYCLRLDDVGVVENHSPAIAMKGVAHVNSTGLPGSLTEYGETGPAPQGLQAGASGANGSGANIGG